MKIYGFRGGIKQADGSLRKVCIWGGVQRLPVLIQLPGSHFDILYSW